MPPKSILSLQSIFFQFLEEFRKYIGFVAYKI